MPLSAIVRWLDAHALSIALYLSLAAALLRALYALLARVLAPYPRARAFVEAVAAMAPDVLRFVGQVHALLTGRALPSTPTAPVATQPPVAAPAPVSPLRAVTVSHQPPPPPADEERGSIDVRSMLVVVVALAVALPLGVVVTGCPRMPPVSGCSPMAQTCIADSPHVCSASQRWHRAGALTCAEVGGSCAVVGGRAYCAAPVVDAGAADAADGGL